MAIEAARLFVKVGSDTREGEAGLNSFNDRLNAAARSLTLTGAVMTGALTAPLALAAKTALTSAAGFEQSMNILQQVTGASTEQMDAMSQQALALGADTVFSAGEAANAMLELGKAGMGTEQIMAAIPGVLDLAAAGGVSLANAAGLTAATLNAFGLQASESTRVANLLAAAANASAADISDLGQGMQQAGFAFALANQPVDNLAASLAILTNVGLTGSDAGTALKNAFMRMMNPTNEASDAMKELGINFYDAQGVMLSLPAIIDMLNTATAGLTDQQRDQALATLFMSDGMKAMIPLMNAGAEGFNEMLGAVNEAGAATNVANARMAGLAGAIEYLRGSVDSFLIGAALPFLGTLGGLARGAADTLTWFGALPQPVINATLAFAGVLAVAGPLTTGLGLMAGALAFLLSPIGLMVAGSAVLAAAWAADFGGMQQITATALGQAQQWFASTLASAQGLATGIGNAFANTSFPSLETLWQQFRAGDFQTVADTIRNTAFELMVNLDTELNITGQANELKAQLVGAVTSLGTAISSLDFSAAKANLDGLRDGILGGLTAAIDGVDWGQGGTTFAGMVDSLTTSIQGLDFSAINWADVFKRVLLGPAGAALGALQWVVSSSEFEGLKTSVKGAIGTIDWGELGTSFVGLGTAIGGQIGAVFSDMSADISALIPDLTMPTLPKIDIDWGQLLVIDPVGLVTSVANSINNADWESVGESVGTALLGAVTTSITATGTAIAAVIGAGNWLEETRLSIVASALGLATNIGLEVGTALASVNLFEASAQLQGAIQAALIKMVFGAATAISNGLGLSFKLPDFKWEDFVTPITDWTPFVTLLSWADFVGAISWDDFVSALGWDSFVPDISWSSFVPDVSWGDFVPDVSWGDFLPSLDWGRFIPSLWGGGADSNATGTSYYEGGVTWVGERGPELVGLPRGSRIYNNDESMAMAAGSGVTIVIQNVNIGSDMDIHSAAAKLAREFQRRIR